MVKIDFSIFSKRNFYAEQKAIYRKSLAAFFGLGGAFEIDRLHWRHVGDTWQTWWRHVADMLEISRRPAGDRSQMCCRHVGEMLETR